MHYSFHVRRAFAGTRARLDGCNRAPFVGWSEYLSSGHASKFNQLEARKREREARNEREWERIRPPPTWAHKHNLKVGDQVGASVEGGSKERKKKNPISSFCLFFSLLQEASSAFFFSFSRRVRRTSSCGREWQGRKEKNLTIGLLSCLSLSPNTAGMHLENFFFFKVSTSCYSIGGQMAPLGIPVATGETARAVLLTLPQKKALPARFLTRSFPHTHRWSNMVCPSTDDRRGKASVEWMASGTGDKRSGEKRRKTSARWKRQEQHELKNASISRKKRAKNVKCI